MNRIIVSALILLMGTPLFAQDITGGFMFSGEAREYRLHLPNNTAPTSPVPLVIALHGLGDNMNNFSNIGFSQLSNSEDFMVVYPQASVLPALGAGWRIGTPLDGGISDVEFISQMIDSIGAEYPIDYDRVYATGFSMGSFMSHMLACQLNDRIAAIAGHSGTLGTAIVPTCNGALTTPVMHLHGTGDATIEYPGGTFFGVFPYLGAQAITANWADINGCDVTPDSVRLQDLRPDGYTIDQFTYLNCEDSSEVIHYKVNGFPHNWLQANNDITATPVIWEFFKRHTLANRTPVDTTGPIDTTTGIIEFNLANTTLSVYPNPAQNILNVALDNQAFFGSTVNISIIDLAGRQVKSLNAVAESTIQIDLSGLVSGLYQLQLTGDWHDSAFDTATFIVE